MSTSCSMFFRVEQMSDGTLQRRIHGPGNNGGGGSLVRFGWPL